MQKVIVRSFKKFTGKHLWTGNFVKFLRTAFLQNTSGQLLLKLELLLKLKNSENFSL